MPNARFARGYGRQVGLSPTLSSLTLRLRPTSRPASIQHHRGYTFAARPVRLSYPKPLDSAPNTGGSRATRPRRKGERRLERETGIEPATNSLEGCDSTTELLPPTRPPASPSGARRASPPCLAPPRTLGRSGRRYSEPLDFPSLAAFQSIRCTPASFDPRKTPHVARGLPSVARSAAFVRTREASWLIACRAASSPRSARAKAGGEGRIRTFEGAGATDLQSAAFDRFATSPGLP